MAYSVSEEFRSLVGQSHKMSTRIDLLLDDEIVESNVPIVEGQVTNDYDQSSRGRGSFTLQDSTGRFMPVEVGDLLTPYGTEFRAYRGIIFPDGREELVPLGVFAITSVNVEDSGPSLALRVEGADRSVVISRRKLIRTKQYAKDTPVEEAVIDMIDGAYDGLEYDIMADDFTTPKTVFEAGTDPWAAAQTLASNCGCDLYFDEVGTVVMHPAQTFTEDNEPDWDMSDGENGVFLYVNRSFTLDESVFNYVIVTGEGSNNASAVRAIAQDEDPDSPTFVGGRLGILPQFYSSPLIRTQAQAQRVANNMILRRSGHNDHVELQTITNPAIQVGDLIRVQRATSNLNSRLVIADSISIPLVAQRGMSITSRRQIVRNA